MRSMRATWPWLGVLTNSCAQLEGGMGRRYNIRGNNTTDHLQVRSD